MNDLLKNDMFWLVVALLSVLLTVIVLSVDDKVIDERLIGGGVLVLIGALATHAKPRA